MDKEHLTRFGRAMRQLGIHMIPACSPDARGCSERAFGTHRMRLPKEPALAKITDMAATNRYLHRRYRQASNAQFAVPAAAFGSAYLPWIGANVEDILCEHQVQIQRRSVNPLGCAAAGKSLRATPYALTPH